MEVELFSVNVRRIWVKIYPICRSSKNGKRRKIQTQCWLLTHFWMYYLKHKCRYLTEKLLHAGSSGAALKLCVESQTWWKERLERGNIGNYLWRQLAFATIVLFFRSSQGLSWKTASAAEMAAGEPSYNSKTSVPFSSKFLDLRLQTRVMLLFWILPKCYTFQRPSIAFLDMSIFHTCPVSRNLIIFMSKFCSYRPQ